jgi:hypothetical protein
MCATETTVYPHASAIALSVLPEQAYQNLVALRADYLVGRAAVPLIRADVDPAGPTGTPSAYGS